MQDELKQIESVDLNLLRVLDVLLDEMSVTEAAKRLGRTPSAVSHALSRLREMLDDPLLLRSGNRLVASPRAEALREPLRRVLTDLMRVVQAEAEFDPATSTRRFVVAAPDSMGLFAGALLGLLREQAPRVRLELRLPVADALAPNVGAGAADLLVVPAPTRGEGLMMKRIGAVSHGVVLRRGHPALVDGALSREAYTAQEHVYVRTGRPGESLVGRALQQLGLQRQVGMVVPAFVLAPMVASSSDLLFTAPRALVQPLVDRHDLCIVPVPVPIPDIPVAVVWHRRLQEDQGHRWFRERLAAALSTLLGGPATAPRATASPPDAQAPGTPPGTRGRTDPGSS